MRKIKHFLGVTCLMVVVIAANAQDDFTVTCTSPSIGNGYIKPMKAGSSLQFQVMMKNNKNVTYTASIDKSKMPYGEWVQIDNNSQTLAPNQTVTFLLTLTVPAGTSDLYTYSFPFYFNAYDSNNNNNPYLWTQLTLIVDNAPPVTPSVSISSKSSTSVSVAWSSYDERSSTYTLANSSSGENGIKSYTIALKSSDGTITIGSQSYSSPTLFPYTTTFTSLNGNTEYKVFVTAVDLASNSSISPALAFKNQPNAPAILPASGINYCSATLNWSASPGATSYNVYQDLGSNNSLNLATVTTSSYNVTGLLAGTNSKYFVIAESDAGDSPKSSLISVTTLAVPLPTITGQALVCSSPITFTATAPPSGISLTWSNLNLKAGSASGNTASFTSNGYNGYGSVTAKFDAGCGSKSTPMSVVIGSPVPGSVSIDFNAPPNRFTATIDGIPTATNYKWYLDGILKFNTSQTSVIFNRQLANCGHVYYVDVTETNACGTSTISHGEVSEDPCYYGFSVSPNPAASTVTLAIGTAENSTSLLSASAMDATKLKSKFISTSSYIVRIYDNFGVLKSTSNQSGDSVTLPVGNLDNGIYIVEVNDGKNSYKQQMIIQH